MTAALAVDTSVVVPALVRSHEGHVAAGAVLADHPGIPMHVALESYSVLTRLPLSLRVRGSVAADLLARTFPVVITLDEEGQCNTVPELAEAGIAGGAVYDGIVALTALRAGATLCTRDRRARSTYEALGVKVQWVD